MHVSTVLLMNKFFEEYLKPTDRVLEVGSKGSDAYRQMPSIMGYDLEYVGMDIERGINVDVIVRDNYNWTEFEDNSFDVVISGQVFEHVEFFWLTFNEMVRVLKPNGYMCVIVPRQWKQHRCPKDCWRFLSDSMRALAKWGKVNCIRAEEMKGFSFRQSGLMIDCIGVFQK